MKITDVLPQAEVQRNSVDKPDGRLNFIDENQIFVLM
jgi:hypothetical protein